MSGTTGTRSGRHPDARSGPRSGTRSGPRPGGRPAIDPRLRARRVAVARAQGRRRLRIFLAAAMVVCLAGAGWLAVQSPLLDVDRVAVRGTDHLSAGEVQRAAGVEHRDALLLVDGGAVARRVERLPWAGEVSVGRRLPGTLVIEVTERRPVAWVRTVPPAGAGGADESAASGAGPTGGAGSAAGVGSAGAAPAGPVALLDAEGRVLDVVPRPPDGLGELRGVGRVPEPGRFVGRGAAVLRAVAGLPAGLRAEVASARLHKGRAVVRFRSGPGAPPAGEVRFGDLVDLPAKVAAAVAVLDRLDGRVAYLDVSVPGAPVTG